MVPYVNAVLRDLLADIGTVYMEPAHNSNLRTALKEAVRQGGTSKTKP
jgi:hypothetical protein